MLVCTLGDLVLDVIVRLQQPLAPGGDATSAITVGAGRPGGERGRLGGWRSAAGRGGWACRRPTTSGAWRKRGSPPTASSSAARAADGRGGVIVSLVDPDGGRTMCPDRGAAVGLEPSQVDTAWLEGCDWLHVSGYALFVEPVRSAALRAVEAARSEQARVSVDLSSWSGIRDAGIEEFGAVLERVAPDVVFSNEDEARTLGVRPAGAQWIEKRGAAGCSFDGDVRAALAVEHVVDTTGAGDALAAGWLVGGPDLALEAAARCVGRVGAMP